MQWTKKFFQFWIAGALLLPSFQPQLAISAPVLKWQRAGCYSSWCETGWYSSPAVIDLDKDGDVEIIGGLYSLFMLDGATGTQIKRVELSGSRVWSDVAVADVDNNGDLEVITTNGRYVYVLDHTLTVVWSRQPIATNELRSLAVYDLDNNGDMEILVASTRAEDQWYVYEHDGSLRSGDWPQHSPDSDTNGYTAGCFNQNIAAGDMDGDGLAEIIGTNDMHYTAAFFPNGSQMPANTLYGTLPGGAAKPWSRVGMHVDHAVDLRGYAHCGTEHRPNFAHSAPTLTDLDGNGTLEAVIVGNVYNCGTSPYTDLYEMPFLFNKDRTRWSNSTYNWTVIPSPDGAAAPRSENYNVIESNHPNPVTADLDGDGNKEILYPSYDGRMHVYWLDKTEHGNWPFAVTQNGEGFLRFASAPVIADLDNNGQAEVIFASWVQKDTSLTGKLHILDSMGNPLHQITLPLGFGYTGWNGVLASPTLANIDGDPDLEVVLTSAHSGFLAYDLPNTANARILWATGRGNFQRSASPITGDLSKSNFYTNAPISSPGQTLTYTIQLKNLGPGFESVSVNNPIPANLTYSGGLTASSGAANFTGGAVTWSGAIADNQTITIQYQAAVNPGITQPTLIISTTTIDDELHPPFNKQAHTFVNGIPVFLPVIQR
jgi:uncharacterized repeat protein (TIGR01451 family)